MGVRGVLRTAEGGALAFWCPGCQEHHGVNGTWSFNGDYDRPTFSPSVLVSSGHYMSTHKPGDSCWCTYNARHPDEPSPFKCHRCHSFVRGGMIEFLSDSTHHLAGKTVPLPPPPGW